MKKKSRCELWGADMGRLYQVFPNMPFSVIIKLQNILEAGREIMTQNPVLEESKDLDQTKPSWGFLPLLLVALDLWLGVVFGLSMGTPLLGLYGMPAGFSYAGGASGLLVGLLSPLNPAGNKRFWLLNGIYTLLILLFFTWMVFSTTGMVSWTYLFLLWIVPGIFISFITAGVLYLLRKGGGESTLAGWVCFLDAACPSLSSMGTAAQ